MPEERQELESLHERAAVHYLQGEYDRALEAWRDVLRLDPKDERAIEGVRLCEMLGREARSPRAGSRPHVPPTEPEPEAEGGPPAEAESPAIGFGIGEDLDQSLDRLDAELERSDAPDWMDATPASEPDAEQAAAGPGATEGEAEPDPPPPVVAESTDVDLSGAIDQAMEGRREAPPALELSEAADLAIDAPGLEQEASRETPPERGAPDPGAEAAEPDDDLLDDLSGIFDESPTSDRRAPPDAASEELKQRVNELMAEAMQHYERGEREEALAALGRLAILDEDNEAAQVFADHIRSEMTSEAEPAVERGDELNHEPLELDTGPEPAATVGAGPEATEDHAASGAGAGGEPQAPGEKTTDAAAAAREAPPAEPEPASRRPAKRVKTKLAPAKTASPVPTKWLVVAAGAVLLVGGLYVALHVLGGGDATSAAPATPTAAGDAAAAVPQKGKAVPAAPGARSPGKPAAEKPPAPVDPDEALVRGRRAMDSGDYAAAVVAFNEVLSVEPDHAEARRRLEEAGELYRQQKELLERRAEAIEAFNGGDYRNALRLFYRMPAETAEEQARLRNYVRNGWYNMGVQALVSGDCRLARDHLREARQIDADDPLVRRALDLAARCGAASQSGAYYDAVRALPVRGLED